MGFIQDILDAVLYEIARMWAELFTMLGRTVFFIEDGIGSVIGSDIIDNLFTFMSAFAISLVLLKVLKKGFWTYILWRDGDPDTPIQQVAINVVLAVVTAIAFPTLYSWFAEVCLWLIEKMSFAAFGIMSTTIDAADLTRMITAITIAGFVPVVATIIYFIMLFILYLQFIKRSAELLLLRLGFPLACLGLLDSDNGVFTTTVKTFIQVALTSICQLFCMACSISIFIRAYTSMANLLYCIAFCMAAFATPRMLQFILMPTGGGGMQKVGSTLYAANLVKGLLGK